MNLIIGFSTPKTFNPLSYLIKWYLDVPYSHSYLKWTDPNLERTIIYEASHLFVHYIEFNNWLAKNNIIYEFSIDLDENKHKELMQFCIDNCSKPYNFTTLIDFVFKTNYGNDGESSYICSELVARALSIDDIDQIDPKTLYNLVLEKFNHG